MSRELLLLVDALAREKNVARAIVFDALEQALARRPRSASAMRLISVSRSITKPVSTRRFVVGWLSKMVQ